MLKGETNTVDLLLVEALRAFFPEVYDIVREHHVHFSAVEPERQARGAGAAQRSTLRMILQILEVEQRTRRSPRRRDVPIGPGP
jgi:predicted KAP-like P-loop ATPase